MKRRQSRVARSLTLLRGRALYARVSLLTGWRSMRASTICCRATDGPKNLMPDPLSTVQMCRGQYGGSEDGTRAT
jgi:hypothetical protein